LKKWTTPDSRNTPSTTNLEEEEIVDAPGNDGNSSMPEQVKRPNAWRTMMMMIVEHQISCKSVQLEPSCSVRTDGQTDGKTSTTKLIVTFFFFFCNFASAPKHSAHGIYYAFVCVCVCVCLRTNSDCWPIQHTPISFYNRG